MASRSASMPSPVSAETAIWPSPALKSGRSHLFATIRKRPCSRAFSIRVSRLSNARSAVDHDDRKIRIRHGLEAALDAEPFDHFMRFADSRRIDKAHGNSGKLRHFRNHVARCAGNFRDDGAVLFAAGG